MEHSIEKYLLRQPAQKLVDALQYLSQSAESAIDADNIQLIVKTLCEKNININETVCFEKQCCATLSKEEIPDENE